MIVINHFLIDVHDFLDTKREFKLKIQWLKVCKIDEESNWTKLAYHYSYYYVNCYYLEVATKAGERGAYVGIRAFEDRLLFIKSSALIVQLQQREEFKKQSHWQEMTSELFHKCYLYKNAFFKAHKQVNDKRYSTFYGFEDDDYSEAQAPLVKVTNKQDYY